MSRSKGTANLAASLEVLAGAPLDAREKVPTKADLYLAANFHYPYVGLETYVVSENKKYRLIGNDVTVEANWEEVGSGGGGGTTVVANPEGEATDELEKLQVGNDIYSIPQGGSGADTEIIADDFDATESYAVGDYVVYEGVLYKCTTAHTGEWDASDFDDTQVMEEMPTPMPAADMSGVVTPLPSVMSRRFKYSTEEQVVGEWIDGKPLYQKSFDITETTIHGAKVFEITLLSNVDKMISQNFMFMDEGLPSGKPIPKACWVAQDGYTHEASGYWYASYFYINPTTHDLKMRRDGNSGVLHLYGTIQYTKTTD